MKAFWSGCGLLADPRPSSVVIFVLVMAIVFPPLVRTWVGWGRAQVPAHLSAAKKAARVLAGRARRRIEGPEKGARMKTLLLIGAACAVGFSFAAAAKGAKGSKPQAVTINAAKENPTAHAAPINS